MTAPEFTRRDITLANWRQHPFSRWAFQNVRQILPTAEVWRGTGAASVLETAPLELGSLAFTRTDGATQTVDQLLEEPSRPPLPREVQIFDEK